MNTRFQINPLLMSELRFTMMAYLHENDQVTFNELLEMTKASRGNLSVQLKKLSEKKYITTERKIKGSYTETICKIRPKGREALLEHLKALREMVKE